MLYSSSTAVILVTVVIATEENTGCPLRCREELFELFNATGTSHNPPFTVLYNITRFGKLISDDNHIYILLDGCSSEVTDSIYKWPEASIGSIVMLDCPCGGLSLGMGSPVSIRSCTGDYNNGGSWTLPNNTQCNFDHNILTLCNITLVRKRRRGGERREKASTCIVIIIIHF